ncbi:MAG: hypothetical protein M3P18_10095, partial [Actinomycetota bacterium]|nr:hypothetical protein [Actinomycetota bacterium]
GDLYLPPCLYSRPLKASPLGPARKRSSTPPHALTQLVSPGKRRMPFVRRRISSNESSDRFEDLERLRSRGEVATLVGPARQVAGLGDPRSSSPTNARNWCSTSARSGASSIERRDEHALAVKLVRPTTSLELVE